MSIPRQKRINDILHLELLYNYSSTLESVFLIFKKIIIYTEESTADVNNFKFSSQKMKP